MIMISYRISHYYFLNRYLLFFKLRAYLCFYLTIKYDKIKTRYKEGGDEMKIKQQTVNASMLILLFFLLLQQSFRILHLNIGMHTEVIVDIKFFLLLIASVYFIFTILYLLIAVCVIRWTIYINLYIPLKQDYIRIKYNFTNYFKVVKKYQRLGVVRC